MVVKVPDLGSIDATMQAMAVCREHGMQAFLGGSCTETDLSAQVVTSAAAGNTAAARINADLVADDVRRATIAVR